MNDRQPVEGNITVGGNEIAYVKCTGASPGVMFFGGFKSDMTGTKATTLQAYCEARGQAFVRFDYSGHGRSSGRFEDGTIGAWAGDAVAVLDEVAVGPQIVIGSSMGGWTGLLAALARPERVAAFVGIAAAPDFTEDMMWAGFSEDIREQLRTDGIYYEPSEYDEGPLPITYALIEEARDHLLLRGPIALSCPVRLIQGMQDSAVPWQTALKIAEQVATDDVEVSLVKGGDHRLSEPADIARLHAVLDSLLQRA